MNSVTGLCKGGYRKSSSTEDLQATLWRCEKCSSFIAIHSQHPVLQPICPICIDGTIEFCGPLPAILELQFADA
jgi:ABC-type ATPase with predicted acetyltransferase domain